MGSDCSPLLLFDAVESAASAFPKINLMVFLTQEILDLILLRPFSLFFQRSSRLEFKVVPQVITMEEDPLIAIREKKESTLVHGLKLLKRGYLDGFISAGNTGALIAGATLMLPLIEGIKRPALLANLPSLAGDVIMLDVGGNISCKASLLVQFAKLGADYQRKNRHLAIPRVGLLNIGVESKKGTTELRQAYQLLSESAEEMGIEFIGNVEGRDVFEGRVDVIVTDGFAGNIFLKTAEGVSDFMIHRLGDFLREEGKDPLSILDKLKEQFGYESHGGAILCGLDALVMKCHGQTSSHGFFCGIKKMAALLS
jgi:glycerol-3-phosphate acyltransferase PlsX